jgi:O-antigen/teichoic acid export membrane protein
LRATLTGRTIWWLPIGMWASATYATLSIWMIRRRDFSTIGTTKITQGVLQAAVQVGLGITHIGSSGLIAGQIAGSSGGLVRLWRTIQRESPLLLANVHVPRLKRAAVTYRRFPVYSGPAALLDAATGAMPLLFIAARFGPVPAGLFTLVQRVLTMPFALFTVNLGQLVFGDLAMLRRSHTTSLMPTFRRRVVQIAALGLALILPMMLIVPLLLPRLFGERWSAASTYFLILAPMIFANFVSSPFGFVIDVVRRQDLHLLRDSVRVLLLGMALLSAVILKTELLATLAIISLAGTISGLFYLLICWQALASYKSNAIDGSAPPLEGASLAEATEGSANSFIGK